MAQMVDPARPIVLISSNYHMDRATQTAEKAGFSEVLRDDFVALFRYCDIIPVIVRIRKTVRS